MGCRKRFFLAGLVACTVALSLVAAEKAKAAKLAKGPTRWEETIKKFEVADQVSPPPKGAVLLVGGSNARRWTDVGAYFPQHRVINRGFGGAHLSDVLYFAERIVVPYAPKTILLNAGGNDLSSGKSPEQVRDAARAFVAKVRAALPDTRIYQLALPPVLRVANAPESMAVIRRTNALLADLARTEKNVEFVDLFTAFLDEKGRPQPEFFVEDGTHFSSKGYATVTGLLRGKF
jgi:lysophospholipase L1-like esterase